MVKSLFSFSGRMSRAQFRWALALACALVLLPTSLVFFSVFAVPVPIPMALIPLFPLVTFIGFFCFLAISVKRARGLSDATAFSPSRRTGSLAILEKYFSFSGRMSRQDYLWAHIPIWAAVLIPTALTQLVGLVSPPITILYIFCPAVLMIFVAGFSMLAINTKRMHDLGRSVLSSASPFSLIELLFSEGDLCANAYGPPPAQ